MNANPCPDKIAIRETISHLRSWVIAWLVMTFLEKKSCQEFSEAIGNNSELKY
jgi:hypothetical protein